MPDQPASPPDERQKRLLRARWNTHSGPATNISRRVQLGGSPHDVYRTLVDPERHAALIGEEAEPGAVPGDAVVLAGGRLTGLLVEVLEDRHVVFAVQSAGEGWPARYYATTTFMLRPEEDGTALVLFAQGVPEEFAGELAAIWQEAYLDRLAATFPVAGPRED